MKRALRMGTRLMLGGLLMTVAAWPRGAVRAEPPPSSTSLTNLAEELPLEQLGQIPILSVTTASRHTQVVAEAPASVTVITAEDIRQFGYRTLADILRSVSGMYVTSDRTYTYLGVRGFSRPSDYNSRVLVMVDGHRLNDSVFEGAYIGQEFILDVDLIDRVEIVRGPSSSLYGSSAFFAVVNVITRRAIADGRAEVAAAAGSFDTLRGRFTAGGVHTNAGAEWLLSGSLYNSRGQDRLYYREFDDPATHGGVADDLDDEEAGRLYGRLRWNDLTLSAAYVDRRKSIPTAAWDTVFDDPRYEAEDAHGYVDLQLQHDFSRDLQGLFRLYYDDVRYRADYPIGPDAGPADAGLNRDRTLGRTVGGELQAIRTWQGHTVTLGGEWRRHLDQDIANYDLAPYVSYVDIHADSYDGGIYLQDELAVCTNLHLSLGGRYDYYESFGGTLNPRLGLMYSPWEKGTCKLLYGTAYRAPNAYERYFPLGDLPVDPQLDPERITTYEAVFEQLLTASLQLTLAGFYYYIDDLLAVDPDTLLFQNAGEVRTRGGEASLEWHQARGWRVRASYTLQQAEDADTGERLSNSPEHLAKLNLVAPLWRDRLSAGLELQYVSRADTLADEPQPYADAYCIANLTLYGRRVAPNLDLSISVYNLFDTTYANPGGEGHVQNVIEQDGRSLQAQMTYTF